MPSCGERLVWIILEVLLQNNLSNKQKQGAPLLFSYYSFFFRALPWLGDSPKPLFFIRALPCGGYHVGGTQSHRSGWGCSPDPFFIRASPCGGYPQTPSQAMPATVSSYPTLSYRKRGLRTTLQTSRQSLAGGLIDSGQKPPSVKDFLYGSQSLCPFGASHGLLHPRFRRPLERGSMSGVTKRRKSPMRKGVQRTDYAKRWSMKGLDKAQRFS